jgi:transcriptional regulator with XRE-family HTH domain
MAFLCMSFTPMNKWTSHIMIRREFGKRLRSKRKALGWKTRQLANESGTHWMMVTFVECGFSAPRLLTILRLANALQTDPGYLVQGLGELCQENRNPHREKRPTSRPPDDT